MLLLRLRSGNPSGQNHNPSFKAKAENYSNNFLKLQSVGSTVNFNNRVAKYKRNILNKVSKDPIVELIENFDFRVLIQNSNLI